MRVITGSAKGRQLRALAGLATRPTSDKVKEALFNILSDKVIGIHFLDLYAGTGNIGIEALSRGAAECTFIEKSPAACAVLRENVVSTGFLLRAEIICRDVFSGIKALSGKSKFEIVFMDPPYAGKLVRSTLEVILGAGLILPGSLIIAEHSKREHIPEEVGEMSLIREERYGDTVLSFYGRR